MRRILVIGGGYAGFYTAWKLEKKLRRDEAEVVVVDPRPYLTYQPFLPEVVAGSMEARHAAVSLRRNLPRTKLVAGMVNNIAHADRTVTIRPAQGPDFTMTYDVLVVTAGAVTRTFDVPGVADRATTMASAEDGHVVLSDGTEFDSELIVWTAGNAATRLLRNYSDLPHTPRGLVQVRADLRIGTDAEIVPDAWSAGDDAAVPDLASSAPGAFTVPNAQNAVRQGKRLAKNLVRALRGREPRNYLHHSFGAIATLGLGNGIFQYRGLVIKGRLAWLMHRGYHVLAIPTWDRKVRVLAVWLVASLYGRDIVSLASVQSPREAFRAEAEANSLSSTHSG